MAMNAGAYQVSASEAYDALKRIKKERIQAINEAREAERRREKLSEDDERDKPKSQRLMNLSGYIDEPIYLIASSGSVVIVPTGTEIVFWQSSTLAHAPEEFPSDVSGTAWCTMFDYEGKKQVTVYSLGGVLAVGLGKKPSIDYNSISWTQQ